MFVQEGTTYADTGWVCTVNAGGTLGTTPITYSQFSGAGSYTAGPGLALSGTQFYIPASGVTPNTYGGANKVSVISVNSRGILTSASESTIAIASSQVTDAGTMITQNASSVAITGGTLQNTYIGTVTPATGAFTNLTATGTVSGVGFSNYLASPPAIGGTAAAAISGLSVTVGATTDNNKMVLAGSATTGGFTTLTNSGTAGYSFNTSASGNAPLAISPYNTALASHFIDCGTGVPLSIIRASELRVFNGTSGTTPTGNGFTFVATNTNVSPNITAYGVDTNISLTYTAKGTGYHIFNSYADRTARVLQARSNVNNIANATDTIVNWDNIDVNTTGMTYSGGVWTNSSGRALVVTVSYQVAFESANSGIRAAYLTQNATTASAGTLRYGQVILNSTNGDATFLCGTATLALAAGDVVRLYAYQTHGGTITMGGGYGGATSGYSTRLQMAVIS